METSGGFFGVALTKLVILCYKVIVVFYHVVIDQNQFFNFVLGQLLTEQCQVTAKHRHLLVVILLNVAISRYSSGIFKS